MATKKKEPIPKFTKAEKIEAEETAKYIANIIASESSDEVEASCFTDAERAEAKATAIYIIELLAKQLEEAEAAGTPSTATATLNERLDRLEGHMLYIESLITKVFRKMNKIKKRIDTIVDDDF